MNSRVSIKTEREEAVHFSYVNALTLCGLEMTGDPDIGIGEARGTTAEVDCSDCIAIVEFGKGVRASEIKK